MSGLAPATGMWRVERLALGSRPLELVLRALTDDAAAPHLVLSHSEPGYGENGVFVAWDADLQWTWEADESVCLVTPAGTERVSESGDSDPFESIRTILKACVRAPAPQGFASVDGFLGYFSYDAIRRLQNLPNRAREAIRLPVATFFRPTTLLHIREQGAELEGTLAVHVREESEVRERRAQILSRLENYRDSPETKPGVPALPASNLEAGAWSSMFARARELVLKGPLRQLGISERFTVEFRDSVVRLFCTLMQLNPSPYLYAFRFGGHAVVGASPRSLIRVADGAVTLRPVGGTKPRPADRTADRLAVAELLADSKEVGEHLMLLEAWVSDLARITAPESIKVADCLSPERFSHVIHLGSTITGRLAPHMDVIDAFKHVLPAPTVVGVPKAAAIEAIEELEGERRGIYGGAIGRLGTDGTMEMYIALRTAVVENGRLHVQAGAGIVRNSSEEYEHREICNKVGAILAAVELLERHDETASA